MKQLVIMPGGFHPFHAGHLALYNSARQAFPNADVKVAATNDTSTRPFPFKLKEKLAQLAGVSPGDFYQVKSPFRADEITKSYDPADTQLIFVRSEKDATKPPQPGGIKRDGTPSYLQPISDQMAPMTQHAYMAYLPTVEFGPGMTSATQIRTAWPSLNERQRTALVMSLYPNTQKNPKLANTVVKMLDTAMGSEAEGLNEFAPDGFDGGGDEPFDPYMAKQAQEDGFTKGASLADGATTERAMAIQYWHTRDGGMYKHYFAKGFKQGRMDKIRHNNRQYHLNLKLMKDGSIRHGQHSVDEEVTRQMSQGGMTASYQSKYNQPIAEDYLDEARS
jgi:hypothetical protein